MREIILDGRLLTTKNAMYAHFSRVFELPDHFGRNLDALWDTLTEDDEPTIIYFKNVGKLIEEMDGYGEKVLKLFNQLDKTTDNYTVRFYPEEIIKEK